MNRSRGFSREGIQSLPRCRWRLATRGWSLTIEDLTVWRLEAVVYSISVIRRPISMGFEVFEPVQWPVIEYVEKSDGRQNRFWGSKPHISVIYELISIGFNARWSVQRQINIYGSALNLRFFPIFQNISGNLRKLLTWLFTGGFGSCAPQVRRTVGSILVYHGGASL